MSALETIPGPMPYAMRAMLTRDNQADADAAVRAIAQYAAAEVAHKARAWRVPHGAARRAHIVAAMAAHAALADETGEITTQPTRTER